MDACAPVGGEAGFFFLSLSFPLRSFSLSFLLLLFLLLFFLLLFFFFCRALPTDDTATVTLC